MKIFKKLSLISLILIFSCCFFIGCKPEYMPPIYAASSIRLLEDTPTQNDGELLKFNTHTEFSKNEISEEVFSIFDRTLKDSFYNKDYFKKKKLAVYKFNSTYDGLFIEKIDRTDDKYTVTISQHSSYMDKREERCYGLFLETPHDVTNAEVELIFEDYVHSNAPIGTMQRAATEADPAFEAFYCDSVDAVQSVKHYDVAIIKAYLDRYAVHEENYFDTKAIVVGYLKGSKIKSLSYRQEGDKIIFDVFRSTAYIADSEDPNEEDFLLAIFEVDKATPATKVLHRLHTEADVDKNVSIVETEYTVA